MEIKVFDTSKELGKAAAVFSAQVLNRAIAEKGKARLLMSTGASQFDTIEALRDADVEWDKVEMFHLDEYIGLPETHPASFRKYLKERFLSYVDIRKAHLVNPDNGVEPALELLTREVRAGEIDLGLIGIGENAHIAFNDPPADFETKEAFLVVNLDEACKKQQMREGWFATIEDVPKQAISMSVYQIMQCKTILSCVPYAAKADAVKKTLESDLTIVSLFIQSLDRKLSLQQQKIWRRADTVFSRRTACRNSVEFSETIWLRRAARRKFSVNMAEGAVFYVNCGEKAVYTPVYRRYV